MQRMILDGTQRNHVSAIRTDGNRLDMWWRSTVDFQKIDGRWRITYGHNSVPFNMVNGKAYRRYPDHGRLRVDPSTGRQHTFCKDLYGPAGLRRP